MKKFKELKKEKVNIIEKEILNNWKKIDILNILLHQIWKKNSIMEE